MGCPASESIDWNYFTVIRYGINTNTTQTQKNGGRVFPYSFFELPWQDWFFDYVAIYQFTANSKQEAKVTTTIPVPGTTGS